MEELDESKIVSLKYKGENRKEAWVNLSQDGFEYLGDDKWRSHISGRVYKFIIYGSVADAFIARVEEIVNNESKVVPTELCDKQAAIARSKREDLQLGRYKYPVKKDILSMIMEFTPMKFLHYLNKNKNKRQVVALYNYLGKDISEDMSLNDFLNVPNGRSKTFCKIESRMSDKTIGSYTSQNGVEYYFNSIEYNASDFIECLCSKRKFDSMK